MRLWEQFDRFEPGTNFAAWACTVARYLVLDHRKRAQKAHLYFRDEVLDVLGAEVETAAGDIPRRLAALRCCVEQLSTKGRELLSQCYASGMQLNKVAEQMGRSVGSLYTAASRLRRQVHDCVEQRLREEDRA